MLRTAVAHLLRGSGSAEAPRAVPLSSRWRSRRALPPQPQPHDPSVPSRRILSAFPSAPSRRILSAFPSVPSRSILPALPSLPHCCLPVRAAPVGPRAAAARRPLTASLPVQHPPPDSGPGLRDSPVERHRLAWWRVSGFGVKVTRSLLSQKLPL